MYRIFKFYTLIVLAISQVVTYSRYDLDIPGLEERTIAITKADQTSVVTYAPQVGATANEAGMSALSLFEKGDFDNASHLSDECLKKDDKNYWGLTAQGCLLLAKGKVAEGHKALYRAALRPAADKDKTAFRVLRLSLTTDDVDNELSPDQEGFKAQKRFIDAFTLSPIIRQADWQERKDTKNRSAQLPFEFSSGIWVSVTMNDVKLRMSLDTGFGGVIISEKIGKKISLDSGQTTEIHGINGNESASSTQAKSLILGDLTFESIPVLMTARSNNPLFTFGDGVIGTSALRQYILQFRIADKKVCIAKQSSDLLPSTRSDTNSVTIPFVFYLHTIYLPITVKMNGREISTLALFDSGATQDQFAMDTLTPNRLIARNTPIYETGSEAIGIGGEQNKSKLKVALQPVTVKIGGSKDKGITYSLPVTLMGDFSNLSDEPGDIKPGLILGTSFFSQFDCVTIDYPKRLIIFQEKKGEANPYVKFR